MPQTLSSVYTTNKLRGLNPVLTAWTEFVELYSSQSPGDACYWYNERATVGVLAAAAWSKKNWVGLEEYGTRKARARDAEDPKQKLDRHGRCDVYLASVNGQAQFACEAKQAWQQMGSYRIKDDLSVIRKARKAASDAAGELMRFEAAHRLALTFCVPSLAIRGRKGGDITEVEVTNELKGWIKKLVKTFDLDGYAYVFPGNTRTLTNDAHKRYFPGVAVLIQKRSRGMNTKAARKH